MICVTSFLRPFGIHLLCLLTYVDFYVYLVKDESPAHCQLWVSAVGNLYPRINKKKKCDFISVLLHEIEMLLQ